MAKNKSYDIDKDEEEPDVDILSPFYKVDPDAPDSVFSTRNRRMAIKQAAEQAGEKPTHVYLARVYFDSYGVVRVPLIKRTPSTFLVDHMSYEMVHGNAWIYVPPRIPITSRKHAVFLTDREALEWCTTLVHRQITNSKAIIEKNQAMLAQIGTALAKMQSET